jgi:alpha-N-arabinofuranosidase
VDGPTYDCEVASDVQYLDVAAVHNEHGGTVTVFILNRHLDEAAELDLSLTGFEGARVAAHKTLQGHDLRATNGPGTPDAIAPQDGSGLGVEDGGLKGSLPPLSYHMIRLEVS